MTTIMTRLETVHGLRLNCKSDGYLAENGDGLDLLKGAVVSKRSEMHTLIDLRKCAEQRNRKEKIKD